MKENTIVSEWEEKDYNTFVQDENYHKWDGFLSEQSSIINLPQLINRFKNCSTIRYYRIKLHDRIDDVRVWGWID